MLALSHQYVLLLMEEYTPNAEVFERVVLESTIDSIRELRTINGVSSYLCSLKESVSARGQMSVFVSARSIEKSLPEMHKAFKGIRKKSTTIKTTNTVVWLGLFQTLQKHTPTKEFGVEGVEHVLRKVKSGIRKTALSKELNFQYSSGGQWSDPVDEITISVTESTVPVIESTIPEGIFDHSNLDSYLEEESSQVGTDNSIVDSATEDDIGTNLWCSSPIIGDNSNVSQGECNTLDDMLALISN